MLEGLQRAKENDTRAKPNRKLNGALVPKSLYRVLNKNIISWQIQRCADSVILRLAGSPARSTVRLSVVEQQAAVSSALFLAKS